MTRARAVPGAVGSPLLSDRDAVLQAALRPERINAALDLQRRALADVALENLAVVADVLDDAHGPIVRQTDRLSELALGSDEALDLGIIRLRLLVVVRLRQAEFLGVNKGVVDPAHDVAPLVVAVAHGKGERLLRDDFGKYDVLVGVRCAVALGVEAGGVRGESVAASAVVSLEGLVRGREGDDLVLQVIGAEEVGEVELGRGALLRADRRAVEFLGGSDAE